MKSSFRQLFGAWVDGHYPPFLHGLRVINLYFWMSHREISIEHIYPSKDDNLVIDRYLFLHPLSVFEPNQVHRSRIIGELGTQSLCPALAQLSQVGDFPQQLNIHRLIVRELAHLYEATAVDVAVGVEIEEILHHRDVQHLLYQFGFLWPNAFYKFYGSIEVQCFFLKNQSKVRVLLFIPKFFGNKLAQCRHSRDNSH